MWAPGEANLSNREEPVPPTGDGYGLGSWQSASLENASILEWPEISRPVGPSKLSGAVYHRDQARSPARAWATHDKCLRQQKGVAGNQARAPKSQPGQSHHAPLQPPPS